MKEKKIPMRQCTGCREMKPKKEMIRVLKTADNQLLVDKTGKLNGRGAYICNRPECLEKAISSRGLSHSLKFNLTPDIVEKLREEIG